jgi:uncharacterized protein YdhG (YjbR/CyaY superfamily)
MSDPVDQYLARLPAEQREALESMRRVIRSVVPGVEEAIRRGVPAFRYRGRPLVSIGAAKRHVALYIMYGTVLRTCREELRGFDTSRTVIRFEPSRPLPARLVEKLTLARVAELEGQSGTIRSRARHDVLR